MSASRNDLGRGSTDWRTIDSAPRDGTEILLYGSCERDGRFFAPDCNVGWWDEDNLGGWQARDLPIDPTHWMPLPAPPMQARKRRAPESAELGPGTN
jgi:hypothetical protein